jgi:hypothetical protein
MNLQSVKLSARVDFSMSLLKSDKLLLYFRLFFNESIKIRLIANASLYPPELTVIDKAGREGSIVGGCFGPFTRWAVVFLIIFVLFTLLVPEERERVGY